MTYSPIIQPINPDPGILTLLVIGTAENVRSHIWRQHTLGVAEADAWSKPIPVPNCPGKVMCALNRIMVWPAQTPRSPEPHASKRAYLKLELVKPAASNRRHPIMTGDRLDESIA